MDEEAGVVCQQKVSSEKIDAALDPKRIGHRRSKSGRLAASDGHLLPSNDSDMCPLHVGKAGRPRPDQQLWLLLVSSHYNLKFNLESLA